MALSFNSAHREHWNTWIEAYLLGTTISWEGKKGERKILVIIIAILRMNWTWRVGGLKLTWWRAQIQRCRYSHGTRPIQNEKSGHSIYGNFWDQVLRTFFTANKQSALPPVAVHGAWLQAGFTPSPTSWSDCKNIEKSTRTESNNVNVTNDPVSDAVAPDVSVGWMSRVKSAYGWMEGQ